MSVSKARKPGAYVRHARGRGQGILLENGRVFVPGFLSGDGTVSWAGEIEVQDEPAPDALWAAYVAWCLVGEG